MDVQHVDASECVPDDELLSLNEALDLLTVASRSRTGKLGNCVPPACTLCRSHRIRIEVLFMLALHDGSLNRRRFLSIGSLALGGLSLSSLLAARAAAA